MDTVLKDRADRLMEVCAATRIAYCPKTGQWFTDKKMIGDYQKSTKIKLQIFTKDGKS